MPEMKKSRKRLLVVALVILGVLFIFVQQRRINQMKYQRELEYGRVFSELTEYVDDLEIALLKGQVVSTPMQMAKLSADLYTRASGAKANLALLPLDGRQMGKTSEFLSQVGEYATCVSEKMLKGEQLTEKEIKTMRELTSYASKLKKGFDKMLIDINEGRMSFSGEMSAVRKAMSGGKTAMADELAILEEEFHNYPSLIYDGPFSQHLSLKESVLLKGKPEITEGQAKRRAVAFVGKGEIEITEVNGRLPSYILSGKGVIAEYTKKGGILLMLMRDRTVDEEKVSQEEAKKKAELFLRDNGYGNMTESYYEKREGSIVINYAYSQDGYIVYPDLVKVKVALDNGEIIGFESRGYVMNHTYRVIPAPIVTEEEALKNVNEALEIKGVSKAIIPLDNGSEACCWQIKGVVEGKHFLTFVNTRTGYTEDVQILLESENGTLAV